MWFNIPHICSYRILQAKFKTSKRPVTEIQDRTNLVEIRRSYRNKKKSYALSIIRIQRSHRFKLRIVRIQDRKKSMIKKTLKSTDMLN